MNGRFGVFLGVFLLILGGGLAYSSRVVADLTIFHPTAVDASGIKIVLSPEGAFEVSGTAHLKYHLVAEDSRHVLTRRLDQLGLNGYYGVGVFDDKIEVTLPDNENVPYIINIITRVGEVEFIDGGSSPSPPIGRQVRTTSEASYIEEGVYQILFEGKDIVSLIPPNSSDGEIFYQIRLRPGARERLAHIFEFELEPNSYICLALDQHVINCSTMYHWAGDTLDILPNLGAGTDLNLTDLTIFLNSGPLPSSLEVVAN